MRNLDKIQEIELVKNAIKSTKASILNERYFIILQYLKGFKYSVIADLNCVSTRTIIRCVKLYKEGGLSAILFIPSKGAPRKISSHIATLIAYILEYKSPSDMKLPMDNTFNYTIT